MSGKRKRKRAKCPSCGAGFQKGRMVLRLTTEGAVRQRVCQSCASLATLILACDAPARCVYCHVNLASYCAGCIGTVIDEQLDMNIAIALAKRSHSRRLRDLKTPSAVKEVLRRRDGNDD